MSARGNVDVVRPDTSDLQGRIAATLADLAGTLEGTAAVAELIAERYVERGRSDLAASEREAATRARMLAARLRAVARPLPRRRARVTGTRHG